MPQARDKLQLGNSWVVEDESDSNGASSCEGIERRRSTRQPHDEQGNTKKSRAFTEPELVMPSLIANSIDDSSYSGERPQIRRSPRKRTGKHINNGEYSRPNPRYVATKETREDNDRRPRKQRNQSGRGARDFVLPVVFYCFDVLSIAMRALKTPVSIFLAVYLFLGLLILLRNLFTTSVYSALSPICRIPGISLLNFSMCRSGLLSQQYQNSKDADPPVEFEELINVQSQFESILEGSAGGVSLPLDMKRSETSLRDLRTILRYSSLPSKNELIFEFNGFIETASIASNDLQKFNSHVGRAVDNILATARWTKRVLEGITVEQDSRGVFNTFFNDKLLAPFQPMRFSEARVLQQYTKHTRAVESEINRLIEEAQSLLSVLRNLDDRLDVIHGVAVRDDFHAQGSKEEVMSHLWTMLGGNRKALGKLDSHIKLLDQVNGYRQAAIAHVAGTMLKLQGMGAELEELRERVGTVELVGERKGVPLSVHIESIELGVERLEKRKIWARGVENEQMGKALVGNPDRDKRRQIGGV
ncbi:MAG: hypothetical protein Q9173_004221 [Seirophora scorigena]